MKVSRNLGLNIFLLALVCIVTSAKTEAVDPLSDEYVTALRRLRSHYVDTQLYSEMCTELSPTTATKNISAIAQWKQDNSHIISQLANRFANYISALVVFEKSNREAVLERSQLNDILNFAHAKTSFVKLSQEEKDAECSYFASALPTSAAKFESYYLAEMVTLKIAVK